MLTTLLIDENIRTRQTLRDLIATHAPDLQIIGEANNIQTGSRLLRRRHPHVLFLDTLLADGTGFDLLDQFPDPDFQIIFTTNYEHFALKAFQYQALGFLVKPIDLKALQKVCCKVRRNSPPDQSPEKRTTLTLSSNKRKTNKICLPTNEGLIFLPLEEIVRLEASGCYTTFHCWSGERIVVARTLKDFEKLLPSDTFLRIHQSHLVNIHFVRKILKQDGGYAVLNDETRIPISRRKKEAFVGQLMGISL